MKRPLLILQYPNPGEGSTTIPLAATRSVKVLRLFKEVVLEEARLGIMDWSNDEIITIQNQCELERLEKLLEQLIPDADEN